MNRWERITWNSVIKDKILCAFFTKSFVSSFGWITWFALEQRSLKQTWIFPPFGWSNRRAAWSYWKCLIKTKSPQMPMVTIVSKCKKFSIAASSPHRQGYTSEKGVMNIPGEAEKEVKSITRITKQSRNIAPMKGEICAECKLIKQQI